MDFIALAKANPGKYRYGSSGSPSNLSAELFKNVAKVDIVHISYKGGDEMMTAALSNETQMIFNSAPNIISLVNSGKLRALAVMTAPGKRLSQMPDVPSFSQAGLSGMTVYAWNG